MKAGLEIGSVEDNSVEDKMSTNNILRKDDNMGRNVQYEKKFSFRLACFWQLLFVDSQAIRIINTRQPIRLHSSEIQ